MSELSDNHWRLETYSERITTREWRRLLLSGGDTIIFRGHIRQLKAKLLGAGVVEVSKEPLKEQDTSCQK